MEHSHIPTTAEELKQKLRAGLQHFFGIGAEIIQLPTQEHNMPDSVSSGIEGGRAKKEIDPMSTQSNDTNPNGTKWYNTQFYGKVTDEPCYPEEDHQVAALPKTLLIAELAKRLGTDHPCIRLDLDTREKVIYWREKQVNFSAVSDKQLMHHIGIHLHEAFLRSD